MSQNYIDPTTTPTSSPSLDQDKIARNDDALRTNFSGVTAPTSPSASQFWSDNANNILYQRNSENTNWIFIANLKNGEVNQINSNYNLSSIDNGKTFLVQNAPLTITMPQFSTVGSGYDVRFFMFTDSSVTFLKFGSEQFLRNKTSLDSYIATTQSNVEYHLSRYGLTSQFILAGVENGIGADLVGLTDVGKKAILDFVYPIGSTKEFNNNVTPPLQGILGVVWVVISEGYVKQTGTVVNTGTLISGSRVDTGSTDHHILSVSELPTNIPIAGSVSGSATFMKFNESDASFINIHNTEETSIGLKSETITLSGSSLKAHGSNAGHSHTLGVRTYNVLTFKRIS